MPYPPPGPPSSPSASPQAKARRARKPRKPTAAARLVALYEETFNDLLNLGAGCRALLEDPAHRDDADGTRASLEQIVDKLDRAAEVLRR